MHRQEKGCKEGNVGGKMQKDVPQEKREGKWNIKKYRMKLNNY